MLPTAKRSRTEASNGDVNGSGPLLRDCTDEQLVAELTRRRQLQADARGNDGLLTLWSDAVHQAETAKLHAKYEVGKLLGQGAFGKVSPLQRKNANERELWHCKSASRKIATLDSEPPRRSATEEEAAGTPSVLQRNYAVKLC